MQGQDTVGDSEKNIQNLSSYAPYALYGWNAAATKSLQSCPTLCDPIDGSPLGSSVPGILQARILEWVAISFSERQGKLLPPISAEQGICSPTDVKQKGNNIAEVTPPYLHSIPTLTLGTTCMIMPQIPREEGPARCWRTYPGEQESLML